MCIRDRSPAGKCSASRSERRLQFNRVMAVVINKIKTHPAMTDLAITLEAATDPSEIGQRNADRLIGNSEVLRNCNRGQRVSHVVQSSESH